MNRRDAMKIAAGAVIGGGAGVFTLANAFKPEKLPIAQPEKLEYVKATHHWQYDRLEPKVTAQLAYSEYSNGSCMYATFYSIVSQLAERFGEPYNSFPFHMMKYGHGGVGGFGTICGTLNGAAAAIGLLVSEKKAQDALIAELFRWYENNPLPEFKPRNAVLDYDPPTSTAQSTLCHASITNWGKASGEKIESDRRKERCRRITADVSARTTGMLNEYFSNTFVATGNGSETAGTCMQCHGDKGKLGNTGGKMSCTSCHDESIAHKVFADVHHQYMKGH